jgi:hypothetical protein
MLQRKMQPIMRVRSRERWGSSMIKIFSITSWGILNVLGRPQRFAWGHSTCVVGGTKAIVLTSRSRDHVRDGAAPAAAALISGLRPAPPPPRPDPVPPRRPLHAQPEVRRGRR